LSVIVCALSPFLRLTLTHLVHLVRPDATIIEAATAADLQGLDGDGATRVVIIAAAEYDAFQHVLLTLPAPVIALALTPTERRRLTDRYRHGQLVYAPSALLLSRWFEHALHTAAETARGPKRALPPFDVLFPDGIPLLEPLSPQEVRLALFDMFGCSAKEIALALGVSEASVQGYWKRIGAKLALDRATIRTWVQTRLVPGHASAAATPFVR
jgi:DNA-binding NarL/FixJ family response regulator